jgi:hypothetical protein
VEKTYNPTKKRWEVRMPCGRLLWSRGSRNSKDAQWFLGNYNVPMHLGRCWKCGFLHGHPKAVALTHLKFVFDSQSCTPFGFIDTFDPVTQ